MQMTTNVIAKPDCPQKEMQAQQLNSRGRKPTTQKQTCHIFPPRIYILKNKVHVSSGEVSHISAEYALNSYANHSAIVIMA